MSLRTVLISVIALCVFFSAEAFAKQTTWKGGSDTDWHNPKNWDNGVPTSDIDAVISSSSVNPAIIAAYAECRSLTVEKGGSVALMMFGALAVPNDMTVEGLFSQWGGYVKLGGNCAVNGASAQFGIAGGRFVQGDNIAQPNGMTASAGASFTISGGIASFQTIDCDANSSLAITNTGTLCASKSVTVNGTYTHNQGTLKLLGSAAQTVSLPAAAYDVQIMRAANATTTLANNLTVSHNLTIQSGTLQAQAYTLTIGNDLLLNGGTYEANTGTTYLAGAFVYTAGAFQANAGVFEFNGSNPQTIPSTLFYQLNCNNVSSITAQDGVTANDLDVLNGILTVDHAELYVFNDLRIHAGAELTALTGTLILGGSTRGELFIDGTLNLLGASFDTPSQVRMAEGSSQPDIWAAGTINFYNFRLHEYRQMICSSTTVIQNLQSGTFFNYFTGAIDLSDVTQFDAALLYEGSVLLNGLFFEWDTSGGEPPIPPYSVKANANTANVLLVNWSAEEYGGPQWEVDPNDKIEWGQQPTVEFVLSGAEVSEEIGTFTIEAVLHQHPAASLPNELNIPLSLDEASTATCPEDFSLLSNSFSFATASTNGEVSTVQVALVDDTSTETIEQFGIYFDVLGGEIQLGEIKYYSCVVYDNDKFPLFATSTYNELLTVNPNGPEVLRRSGWGGGAELQFVTGVAYDQTNHLIYFVNRGSLFVMSEQTKTPVFVMDTGSWILESLTYDCNHGYLYASSIQSYNGPGLIRIDPQTKTVTVITPPGGPGFYSLAYNANTDTLYASGLNRLLVVDVVTGGYAEVGQYGFNKVRSIAIDHVANILYGIDNAANQGQMAKLLTINASSGVATQIGTLTFEDSYGACVDAASGALYTVSYRDIFRKVELDDLSVEVFTTFALPEYTNVIWGMAYCPDIDKYYGCTVSSQEELSNYLITIDPYTWTHTYIGELGYQINDLAYDPENKILYGVGSTGVLYDHRMFSIDVQTGEATSLFPLPWQLNALTYSTTTHKLYAGSGHDLLEYDPQNGQYSTIFISNLLENPTGMVLDNNFNRMYIAHTSTMNGIPDRMFVVDMGTFSVLDVQSLPTGGLDALTLNKQQDLLIAFDGKIGRYVSLELDTFSLSSLGQLGFTGIGNPDKALTYDPLSGVVYATITSSSIANLTCVNVLNGTSKIIGPISVVVSGSTYNSVTALAWDSTQNKLYGVRGSWLLDIDEQTGQGVYLGTITGATGSFTDAVFNPNDGFLYGISSRKLYRIDISTRAAVLIGNLGNSDPKGLALDPQTNTMYMQMAGTLYQVDQSNGSKISLGTLSGSYTYDSLVWVDD